jgi:PAS domain S-box-containing protein
MQSHPNYAPWRVQAQQRGYASSIALPLIYADSVLGALNVYSKEPDAFDPEEVALLVQLADHLAYGINSLRSEIARQQAEAALHDSQAFLQAFLDHSPSLVFARDLQGRFLLTNHTYESLVSPNGETMLGKTSHDLLLTETAQAFLEQDQDVLCQGGPIEHEQVMSLHDGEHIYLASKFPLYDRQGTIWAIGGISTDITMRKQTEAALAWESSVNAAIAELSSVLIQTTSIDDIAVIVLEHARSLTGSTFGYVGYIDSQTGYLICPTMTRDIWESCQVADKDIVFKTFVGLWGWVLKNRQPLLTNTPQQDPRSTGIPAGHLPIKRFISVPAMIDDNLVGQIALANAEQDYTRRDLILLERLAALYALAVQRKRADDKLQARNQELRAINLFTEAINQSLALPDVLQVLPALFAEHFHIPAGMIYIYHESDNHLSCEAIWGVPPITDKIELSSRFPVVKAHNRQVVWEQTPLLLPELPSDTGDAQQIARSNPVAEGYYLSVPIVAQGELQGVLDLFASSTTPFTHHQVSFFSMLGQQVGTAIQKARLFAEVQSGRERLQNLSHRLVEVQEAERRTIARELHDEIGQWLTGLNLSLEIVEHLPIEEVHTRLELSKELVNELIQWVREMSLRLRPPMLDDLGLLPALLWHFERYTQHTNIKVLFKHRDVECRFDPGVEIAVYRMIQEALTNVARYAETDQATVRLWANAEVLGVQIEDQGCGFDAREALASQNSSGLSGMKERARLLGGELQIESTLGVGSYLTVEFPLYREEPEV